MDKLGSYELNQIYCGDYAILMKDLPNNCIDLTVTSPPYDNLRDYEGYTFDFESIATELFRVTKRGGVLVWVVGDATVNGSETGTSFRQALGFMKLGFNLHDTMIFARQSRYPDSTRYSSDFEYMFVFSKGKPQTINLLKKPNKYAGTTICGTDRQRNGRLKVSAACQNKVKRKKYGIKSNIWKIPVGGGISSSDKYAYQHPAIFPETLARDHILSWSDPNDIIFDPMVGSGTTCKMAKETGRRWLAFDISEFYVELARKRVAQAKIPLFV